MGGVGYGLYFTAKRYIMPLISPPTPPQLEQDKQTIDEQFNRAFALLDQLSTDTTALKASETDRTNRLDTTLGEVESVLASLKESSRRQGDDNRRIEDDVRNLRDLIPKALDAHRETTDTRLKELSSELKSLKTLVGNRMGSGAPRPTTATTPSYYGSMSQPQTSTTNVNATSSASTPAATTPAPTETQTSVTDAQGSSAGASSTPAATPGERAGTPFNNRLASGRASIPAWQMAAAKKSEEAAAEKEKKDKENQSAGGVSESGTIEASSS